MSQQPSQKFPSLHPILQGVLRSLDVDLETTLTQYRSDRALRDSAPVIHQGLVPQQPSKVLASSNLALAQNSAKTAELSVQDAGIAPAPLTPSVEDASLLELTRHRLHPDDYLESSEALLNHLEATKAVKKSSLIGVLLTAWGTSLTVLLLAGVVLSYLMLETRLFGPSWLESSNSEVSGRAVKPSPTAHSSPPKPTEPAIAPDLSAKEFVKLDLSNLSHLKSFPAEQSSPQPTPLITPPFNPPQLATGRSIPTTVPKVARSSPPAIQKQPSPLRVTSRTVLATPGDGYYNVVVNYTSQKVLQQTQKVVKDAYRDFPAGKQIQVGAFNDKQSAQDLVQALKRQGVTATIRQP